MRATQRARVPGGARLAVVAAAGAGHTTARRAQDGTQAQASAGTYIYTNISYAKHILSNFGRTFVHLYLDSVRDLIVNCYRVR